MSSAQKSGVHRRTVLAAVAALGVGAVGVTGKPARSGQYWTIIGKGIEGDMQGRAFGITLDTMAGKWTVEGPSVDLFFESKSGTYKIAGLPENGTQLVNAQLAEVAFFRGLNGTTAVGGKGTGRASEKGVNFEWMLDSQ